MTGKLLGTFFSSRSIHTITVPPCPHEPRRWPFLAANLARIDPLVPLCRPPFIRTGRECPVGVERSTDLPGPVDSIVTALAEQNGTVEPYSKIERPNPRPKAGPKVSRDRNKPLTEN